MKRLTQSELCTLATVERMEHKDSQIPLAERLTATDRHMRRMERLHLYPELAARVLAYYGYTVAAYYGPHGVTHWQVERPNPTIRTE